MSDYPWTALLIRTPLGASAPLAISARRSLSLAGLHFEIEPLFQTQPAGTPGTALAAAGDAAWEWHVARPQGSVAGANAWEVAHEVIQNGLGMAGAAGTIVEPDLLQSWPYENPPGRDAQGLAADATACVFNDQRADLPSVPGEFAWHLGDAFSQLRSARQTAAAAPGSRRIRIGHLDTGYDPSHSSLPLHLRRDLQRNFVDDGPPGDARDPGVRGLLKNPGHGTGTLSILAGNRFRFVNAAGGVFEDFIGGAPEAEIIPLRVGKSVVQFRTSSVAAGISYAADLSADEATRIDVLSMSMGGVASQVWADAVNKAYEAGIVYVAAAGNNFSAGFFGVPTRFIVYPARFRRVIAACGVMANARPYYGLPFQVMQGNWGPASKMATAMAAFTPNMPWAELGCAGIVDMDGQGTSSATPQVAAAAALYLQAHAATLLDPAAYPEPWMRVEAVRHALFSSADKSADGGSAEKLGNGVLQAARALATSPLPARQLQRTPADRATLGLLRVLTGLGLAPTDTRQQMFALEATQLAQSWERRDQPNPLEQVLPDPDLPPESISPGQQRDFLEALSEHPQASAPLREQVRRALGALPGLPTPGRRKRVQSAASASASAPSAFVPPSPPYRKLRGFAIDPSLRTQLDLAHVSEMAFCVPWERLEPGPVGEYLEVVDFDPASGCCYEPVDLDHPALLAQDGLTPSEGTPQFHQQMVYAVASLTIRNFELALGRRTLWRPGPAPDPAHPDDDSVFVRQLRVHPHALRERNAYYSPEKLALLFGYFRASADAPGEHMPGNMVFTCLSHDIVAHETTHALLDGMNRGYLEPTNPDVLAFHEAFADLVAMFQHFTFPEILRHQLAASRGALRQQPTLLAQLAGQFGRGIGLRGALRDAIGKVEEGRWVAHQPDPREYESTAEPHARGSILVAAVFDAFISIYERRTADLVRLASGGTGIPQAGAVHPDLVGRLAEEAAKAAQHVLTMCVRALDYCPPLDITFGEYLRALITADRDLVRADPLDYRISFIEAFRRRGIYPRGIRTLSVQSLVWQGPENDEVSLSNEFQQGLVHLRSPASENLYTNSRERTFHFERGLRQEIERWLTRHLSTSRHGPLDASYLGLDPELPCSVRSARFAYHTPPGEPMVPQLVLTVLQQKTVPAAADDPGGEQMWFTGGSSLVIDLRQSRVRYCIRKNIQSTERLKRQQAFAVANRDSLRTPYLGAGPLSTAKPAGEPFAALHRGT
jgi:subtilisin family serine protease